MYKIEKSQSDSNSLVLVPLKFSVQQLAQLAPIQLPDLPGYLITGSITSNVVALHSGQRLKGSMGESEYFDENGDITKNCLTTREMEIQRLKTG